MCVILGLSTICCIVYVSLGLSAMCFIVYSLGLSAVCVIVYISLGLSAMCFIVYVSFGILSYVHISIRKVHSVVPYKNSNIPEGILTDVACFLHGWFSL